ncbi:MAG: hypothetical protein AB1782_13970 [Cyanobacteriota bacterium]
MNTTTNLAFAIDKSYNYTCEKDNNNKTQIPKIGNNQFIIQTKRALILRENILASGMEVSDIKKAHSISKHITRR